MIDYEALEKFYGEMKEVCLEYFKEGGADLFELADRCMDIEGLPIHCPPHHFMIPAVLLTVCHRLSDSPLSCLEEDLEEAVSRAHNVLGGFCGLYGACGAAVGVGIFMSIFTQTGPCSGETWAWTNRAAAEALLNIAEYDGPRCCKRNSYLALLSACDTIHKYLELDVAKNENIQCRYFQMNPECKGKECPFFPTVSVGKRAGEVLR